MSLALILSTIIPLAADTSHYQTPPATPESPILLRNVVERDGGYELAPGPVVDGVVFLRQVYPREESWPADVLEAFASVPWLDAASVRVRWANLEPRDQEFRWQGFERVLERVRQFNREHPDAPRTVHIRAMGGEHVPAWFEQAGVKMYDTLDPQRSRGKLRQRSIRIPVPYDNPRFSRQLRELYHAMRQRYGADPLVTVYHGTWSAGPWDEIFHPQGKAPLPPQYSPQRLVHGMVEQLDILIDELCLHGKVAELPYSGKYPSKQQIDITGPLTARAVERLGRRSPFLYIQSNGWGVTGNGTPTVSWGHERDVNDAYGLVNLAFQAIGTNAGDGWHVQGDWLDCVALAKRYEASYLEVYYADFMPLDVRHHIAVAFTHNGSDTGPAPGFLGFRPWLRQRKRRLHVREGKLVKRLSTGTKAMAVKTIMTSASVPAGTEIHYRARMRLDASSWSSWYPLTASKSLPQGRELEVEATLRTDDGYVSPRLIVLKPQWQFGS